MQSIFLKQVISVDALGHFIWNKITALLTQIELHDAFPNMVVAACLNVSALCTKVSQSSRDI